MDPTHLHGPYHLGRALRLPPHPQLLAAQPQHCVLQPHYLSRQRLQGGQADSGTQS